MRISDWSSDVCSSDLTPVPYWRSRVSPGRSATSASRVPVRRLNRVDLPTLGRPTRTRVGSLSLVMGRLSVKRVQQERDRKSVGSGKSVSVRVDLGGRRILKQKTTIRSSATSTTSSTRNYKAHHKNGNSL